MRLLATSVCVCSFVLISSVARADTKIVNVVIERHSGEKMRGPAVIKLTHVNVLKYDVLQGVSVTFSGGPDLRLPFIPPIPTAPAGAAPGAAAAVAPGGGGPGGPPDPLAPFFASLAQVESSRFTDVQAVIARALDAVSAATNAIQQLLVSSDAALKADSPDAVLGSVNAAVPILTSAGAAKWPQDAILTNLARLAKLRTDVNAIAAVAAPDKPRYDYLLSRIPVLESLLEAVNSQSASARAFSDAQSKLSSWQLILNGVIGKAASAGSAARAFELDPITIGCGFTFGQNKESKLELITKDRGAAPETPEQRTEIMTVVCSSPVSVSGGFAVNRLNEQEYGFVPSAKTTVDPVTHASSITNVSKIGLLKTSGFRTVPVIVVNTRVWEPNDLVSVAFSAGAGVDVKSGAVGTDVEYLVGPSISFWRTLTVTWGAYVGRTLTLAGGYNPGDDVPTGLSAPPLIKSWDVAQFIALSYRIR